MRNIHKYLLTIILFLSVSVIFADDNKHLTVKGRIVDAQTGEPLAGVCIKAGKNVFYTDFEGYFENKIPSGPIQFIQLDYVSYQTEKLSIEELSRHHRSMEIALSREN